MTRSSYAQKRIGERKKQRRNEKKKQKKLAEEKRQKARPDKKTKKEAPAAPPPLVKRLTAEERAALKSKLIKSIGTKTSVRTGKVQRDAAKQSKNLGLSKSDTKSMLNKIKRQDPALFQKISSGMGQQKILESIITKNKHTTPKSAIDNLPDFDDEDVQEVDFDDLPDLGSDSEDEEDCAAAAPIVKQNK